MRRRLVTKVSLIAAVCAALLAGAVPAQGNHILVSALVSAPTVGSHDVNFVFVEKDTGECCFGQPVIQFGDDTLTCLCAVELNKDTPPGDYVTDLYDLNFVVIGSLTYTVSHVLAPPLPNDLVLTTMVTFSHTYPAAGLYTAKWHDCCFYPPQAPVLEETLQPIIDDAWEEVFPIIQTVEGFEPVGVDQGTLPVIAL